MGRVKKERKPGMSRDGKFYTPEEDAFISREYGKSDTDEIAEALGRTRKAIVARANRLKIDIEMKIPEGYKYCKSCDTVKSFDSFSSKKDTKDGKYSMCKVCDSENSKKRRLAKKIQEALEKNNMIKEQEELQQATKEKNDNVFICRLCGEQRPGEEFVLHNNLKVDNRCRKCRVKIDIQNAMKRIKDGVDW